MARSALALSLSWVLLSAQDALADSEDRDAVQFYEVRRNKTDFFSVGFAIGSRQEYGVSYLLGGEGREGVVAGESMRARSQHWYGVGANVKLVADGLDAQAMVGSLSFRGNAMGRLSGLGVELNLGAGNDGDRTTGVGSVGLFSSAYYFELGYQYQFKMFGEVRPTWLSEHMFSVRMNLPVFREREQRIKRVTVPQ